MAVFLFLGGWVGAGCRGDVDSSGAAADASTVFPGCKPDCTNRVCGPDGCGGTCGKCDSGEICQITPNNGALVCAAAGSCLPDCADRVCGPDGCGNSCGACGAGQTCTTKGLCENCTATCGGECGPDGCGGTCGICEGDTVCGPGFSCVAVGSPCGELAAKGQCSGNHLSLCDADKLKKLDCSQWGLVCSFSAQANAYDCVDAACAPNCTGRSCGTDGCGGSCGGCPQGLECRDGGQCGADECIDDPVGQCLGDFLVTCLGGQKSSVDCTTLGMHCSYDENANDGLGGYDCR